MSALCHCSVGREQFDLTAAVKCMTMQMRAGIFGPAEVEGDFNTLK